MALQEGCWDKVDVVNLVLELQRLQIEIKREIQACIKHVLVFYLKFHHHPERLYTDPPAMVLECHERLGYLTKNNKSLWDYFKVMVSYLYADARCIAATETGLEVDVFPLELPFPPDEILFPDLFVSSSEA